MSSLPELGALTALYQKNIAQVENQQIQSELTQATACPSESSSFRWLPPGINTIGQLIPVEYFSNNTGHRVFSESPDFHHTQHALGHSTHLSDCFF